MLQAVFFVQLNPYYWRSNRLSVNLLCKTLIRNGEFQFFFLLVVQLRFALEKYINVYISGLRKSMIDAVRGLYLDSRQ